MYLIALEIYYDIALTEKGTTLWRIVGVILKAFGTS